MIESRLLARLAEKKAQLDTLQPLPEAAVSRLSQQLAVEWIYHSNAIEGNTLSLRQTQYILETGLTVGGKSLREHFEVLNHNEAIQYVEALATADEPITAFHVRQIHKLILTHIDNENAGQYRKLLVRIAGSDYQPPESWELPRLMQEWSDWLYLEACVPRGGPSSSDDEWILLREAAEGTAYSPNYLRLLAGRGHLEAIKRGRLWYTTRRAIAAYQQSVEQA